MQAAFENDAVREQAKSVLVFETVALVAISIGVTTYATDLFTQILEEEGIDADKLVEDAFGGAGEGDETRERLGFGRRRRRAIADDARDA